MKKGKCRVPENSKERQEGQCKEIEENSRKVKTRDLFKKIGYIKGTFHPKVGTIKDRNNQNRTPQALPASTAASPTHRDLSQASFDSIHATSSLFSPLAGVGWGM